MDISAMGATSSLASGKAPGFRAMKKIISAESAIHSGGPTSIPNVAFVEIDSVFTQQLPIFFLKCAGAMVL